MENAQLKAQPKDPDPVAWLDEYGNAFPLAAKQYSLVGKHWKPLYTTPPQRTWVGLTDEEEMQMYLDCRGMRELLDAIDAKLKQKNGYTEEKNT
jgi:hypothetical protein